MPVSFGLQTSRSRISRLSFRRTARSLALTCHSSARAGRIAARLHSNTRRMQRPCSQSGRWTAVSSTARPSRSSSRTCRCPSGLGRHRLCPSAGGARFLLRAGGRGALLASAGAAAARLLRTDAAMDRPRGADGVRARIDAMRGRPLGRTVAGQRPEEARARDSGVGL